MKNIKKRKFELKKSQDDARSVKDTIFMPLVKISYDVGFIPLYFTVLAFIFGTLSAVSLLLLYSKKLALIFLLLNLFFDGMDGALARYRGKPTRAGWWQDFIIDRLVRIEFFIVAMLLLDGNEGIKLIICIWAMLAYLSLNAIMATTGRRYHINLDFIFYFLLLINVTWAIMFALLETGPGALVFVYEHIVNPNKKHDS
jgi:phosphatidylglycerophosphate synthase